MSADSNDDKPKYKVGFKMPPEEHRFKKGCASPCPDGGRAKKQAKKRAAEEKKAREQKQQEESLADLFKQIVAEGFDVAIDGRHKRMSAHEVVMRRVVTRAMKPDADDKHVRQYLSLAAKAGLFDQSPPEQDGGVLVVYAPMAAKEWEEATEGKLLPENPLHGIPGAEGLLDAPPIRRGTPPEDD
jgi:hypothetical protein